MLNGQSSNQRGPDVSIAIVQISDEIFNFKQLAARNQQQEESSMSCDGLRSCSGGGLVNRHSGVFHRPNPLSVKTLPTKFTIFRLQTHFARAYPLR